MSKRKNKSIYDDQDPIIPLSKDGRRSDHTSVSSEGWKFYLSVRDSLADWWEEFNGSVRKNNKVRYRTAEKFARKKLKDKKNRQYLLWMIGPKKIWEVEARSKGKYVVPWLGDWELRRRNGYWNTENLNAIKGLNKAITEQLESNKAIRATAPFIVQELMRWVRLHEKIDHLFNGEPFYMDENPDSKNNIKRFKLYTSMHAEVGEKVSREVRNWMMIHGIDPRKPQQMSEIAMTIAAQSGAYGEVQGMQQGLLQQHEDGKPNGSHVLNVNGQGVLISPDALLLANHLVQHSKTFRKPIPVDIQDVVEGEVIERKNGHAKTQ